MLDCEIHLNYKIGTTPSADANDEHVSLPFMTASEHVVHDYAATSFSLKAHPVSFIREKLKYFFCLLVVSIKNPTAL